MTEKANDDAAEEANGELREWRLSCQCGVTITVVAVDVPDVVSLGCLDDGRACGLALDGVATSYRWLSSD